MKNWFVLILFLISFPTFAKTVTIRRAEKVVPEGKRWELRVDGQWVVGVVPDPGACTSNILSGQAIMSGLVKTERGIPVESYSIVYIVGERSIDGTWRLKPFAIVAGRIPNISLTPVNLGKIVLFPGQGVFATDCLVSIELEEVDISPEPRSDKPRPEPPREPDRKVTPESPPPAGVIYRVQVFVSKDPSAKNRLKKDFQISEDIYSEKLGALYRFSVGNCRTIEEAKSLLADLERKGIKDPFIVGFKDGKRTVIEGAGGK